MEYLEQNAQQCVTTGDDATVDEERLKGSYIFISESKPLYYHLTWIRNNSQNTTSFIHCLVNQCFHIFECSLL
jgi:hypothetical protein